MAQYTTNYNLYMPDSTDPVGDFRAEFNNNMNIIDNNMSGGGGSSSLAGLTDVSLSSPTNGQVLSYNSTSQKWENANGGGGGGDTYNVYGAFVNTDRVIQSSTTLPNDTPTTYTATEDCAIIVGYYGTATDGYIKINGVSASTVYVPSNSPLYLCETVYVRKGQVVTMKSVQNNGAYTVYGLIQGTNAPCYYGAFIDTANEVKSRTGFHGSDTYTATEDCFVSYELACPTNDNAYVEIDGVAVCTYYYPSVCWVSDTIPLKTGQTISFSNAYSGYSSFYTVYGITQGVNQVGEHYSTSEQVIGTWTNGKPLYQQTITFDTGVTPSNIGVNITSYMPADCVVVDTSFFMEYSFEGVDYRNVNINGGYVTENGTHYFYFSIGSTQYNKHVELTIQYTKSTD